MASSIRGSSAQQKRDTLMANKFRVETK